MGRAIDVLGQKLANAEVARLSGIEVELVQEAAHSEPFVELALVSGIMGDMSTARPGKAPKKKPAPLAGDVRMRDMRTARRAPQKKGGGGGSPSGGGNSDFESLHPRNPDGTFAYKTDTGKGAAGIGTKDKGLPSGKPDGKVHGRISEAQKELVRLGFLKPTDGTQGEAVDGYFGQYTQSALRRFQQDKGLKVTGKIDPATAKALGLKETGGEKKAAAKKAAAKKEPEPVPARLQTAIALLRKLLDEQKVDVNLSSDVVALAEFSTDQREKLADKGAALPDGSYPIRNESDLRNAIKAYGRAKDKAAAKRHIIKRARVLGLTKLLPDTWTVSLAGVDADAVALTTAKGTLDWSPKKNWVDEEGGLPKYIEKIALALVRDGMPRSRAIAIAIGRCKRWAAGGGDVNPDTRAKAAKAIAQWEKMKASARARPNKK